MAGAGVRLSVNFRIHLQLDWQQRQEPNQTNNGFTSKTLGERHSSDRRSCVNTNLTNDRTSVVFHGSNSSQSSSSVVEPNNECDEPI
jgi:hypothetical protein